MNIILSEYGGFCPGVKRADKEIRKILRERLPNEKVYIIGPLIHNDIYNRELEALGANIISFSSINKIVENEGFIHRFVIRTHGVTKEQYEMLLNLEAENERVRVSDLTCPSVKRIHKIAEEKTGDDTFFELYGNAKHDEAIGNISYAKGKKSIVSSVEEIERLDFAGKTPILCSQTTQNLWEFKKIKNFLKKGYTNSIFYDTICIEDEIKTSS